MTSATIERANGLLAWHLAAHIPRQQRESFLNVLDTIAAKFFKTMRSPAPNSFPSYGIRQRLERYLPQPTFTHYPAEPRSSPPHPSQVAELFGADLWKQLLVSPIAAALTESQVRAGTAFSVAETLAHVTLPNPYTKSYPLESHLISGSWRRLFEGLLNPQRKAETDPLIQAGLAIAARGLASMSFVERESLLNAIRDQIERGIDRTELRRIVAEESIERMRIMVEDHLRQALPRIEQPPITSPEIPVPPPTSTSGLSVTRPMAGSDNSTILPSPIIPRPGTLLSPDSPLSRAPVSPPMSTPPKHVVTVEKAEPFQMVSWEEALARAGQVSFEEIRAWLKNPKPTFMLFDDRRTECSEVAIVREEKDVPPVLWIVGDIHADVLSLANILAHVERVTALGGEPPAFVFLGDFVDRGGKDHETLLLLFQLVLKNPGRVCIIPGNHDIDLQFDERLNRFRVSIEPAEYCEQLNAVIRSNDPNGLEQVELAKLLIPFWQSRPKAAIFPDGTLLAHGGFPHTDMHSLLQTPADLARPNCLNDFLWARIAETARKRPNRGNRGHEFGWETFAQFCKVSVQMGLPPIKRLIRGHDHVPKRWQTYPDYADNPVLTINAMGRRMDGEPEPLEGPHPFPIVVRYTSNQLPAVVQLPLDPNQVDRAFGRESQRESKELKYPENPSTNKCPDKTETNELIPPLPPN